MAHYFNNELAKAELINMQNIRATEPACIVVVGNKSKIIKVNRPSRVLIDMIYDLQRRMSNANKYKGYDLSLREEMVSKAMMDFLSWGHNYDSSKSAYSFLTACCENSFKRVLKGYYRSKNLQALVRSALEIHYVEQVDILTELYLDD